MISHRRSNWLPLLMLIKTHNQEYLCNWKNRKPLKKKKKYITMNNKQHLMLSCPRLRVHQNTKWRISGMCISKCLIISCSLSSQRKNSIPTSSKQGGGKNAAAIISPKTVNQCLHTCTKWSYRKKKRNPFF
jgi:hypothetical protein